MSKTILRKFTLADNSLKYSNTLQLMSLIWNELTVRITVFLRNAILSVSYRIQIHVRELHPLVTLDLPTDVFCRGPLQFEIIAFSRNSYPFCSLYLWSLFLLDLLSVQLLKFEFYSNLSEQKTQLYELIKMSSFVKKGWLA